MRKPRKNVLFVDDEQYVHNYAQKVAQKMKLKPRHAFSPEQAERIISLRIRAVQRLLLQKQALFKKAKTKNERAKIARQILALKKMLCKPFNLIVSDINMPKENPSGVAFARNLRKNFPKQKILMHSDDFENLELLEEDLGLPNVFKGFRREEDLKAGIKKALQKTNKKN